MASRLRRNIIANLVSTGCIAAVQLVVTPVLVWKLGPSAFALAGFYTTLVAVLAILDLGLSPLLTRIMARQLPSADAPWGSATVLRQRVAGLGASTKGNVLLQYCGLSSRDLCAIGEVNEDKFGCFTPGSLIPIRSEKDLFADEPDFFLILPWHFRDFFLRKYKPKKAALVFPLPRLEVIPPAS